MPAETQQAASPASANQCWTLIKLFAHPKNWQTANIKQIGKNLNRPEKIISTKK